MNYRKCAYTVALIVLGLTLAGCAAQTPMPTLDPLTGQVAGSIVVKGQPFRDSYTVRLVQIAGGQAKVDAGPCVAADRSGNFVMTQLPPGQYLIMVVLNTSDCNVVASGLGPAQNIVKDEKGNARTIQVQAGALVDLKNTEIR